jgi:hypothetical protein
MKEQNLPKSQSQRKEHDGTTEKEMGLVWPLLVGESSPLLERHILMDFGASANEFTRPET